MKKWAEGEFKTDPQLNLIPSLYKKLINEGLDFNESSVGLPKPQVNNDPNIVSSQQEEDDIAKGQQTLLQNSKYS